MMAKHFPFRLPRSRLAGQTLPSGHGLLSVPAKAFLPAQRLRWRPLLLLLPSPSRQGIPAPKGRHCAAASCLPPLLALLALFPPSLPHGTFPCHSVPPFPLAFPIHPPRQRGNCVRDSWLSTLPVVSSKQVIFVSQG
ncbi:hypothetical protein PVAP13_8NG039702 [Panicum virgatum]|uniref:Uncharacterized protein n=1 Tax=Panicum virgatum TaxID=38727 RepID=A0A8T0P0C1_PANVG|nr:hypothetical protein PVAP13_8NG039702 [Panicum virgatum]